MGMSNCSKSKDLKPRLGKKRRSSVFHRFHRDEHGATAVEFSLIAAPFFFLVFAIFEFTIHFFAASTLDHAVADLARKIRTKQITAATHSAATIKSALCPSPVTVLFDCNKLLLDVQVVASWSSPAVPRKPNGDIDPNGLGYNPGGRNSINIIRAYYEWPTVFPFHAFGAGGSWASGKRLMMSSEAVMIEP